MASTVRSRTPRKKAAAKAKKPSTRPKRASTSQVEQKLRTYQRMRDFERTSEPSGGRAGDGKGQRIFVVQKHAASHLHYDFRLELGGVLLSWSVPKGPTLTVNDRRLAVRTEDHPLDYASFEGTIPKGQYGGGSVIVWDRGTWMPLEDPERGMKKGRLSFELAGEKLRGRFYLVRMATKEKRENWLLFKGDDAEARPADGKALVDARPESVISGRTVEEVAKGVEAAPAKKALRAQKAAKKAAKKSPEQGKKRSPDVLEVVQGLSLPFALTNLEKVLYPEQGLRKADFVAYLAAVAQWMLPHVSKRPLTLVRCPDGRHKHCFFQKHPGMGVPDAVGRVPVVEEKKTEDYMFVNDVPGLLGLAQIGALEIHTWGCHIDKLDRPDQLTFDLDPDETLPFEATVEAAFEVHKRLATVGLESFVKTSGGKGLHVVVPLMRKHGWDEHKSFARTLVEEMAREKPKRYVTEARKSARTGRIFLDYLRNGRGATSVAPYSPRAREGAPVATPLDWQELARESSPLSFTIATVVTRLSSLPADPWQAYATVRQSLPASTKKRAHAGAAARSA
jgi:bifunctional non-homologous end joining protein LigD